MNKMIKAAELLAEMENLVNSKVERQIQAAQEKEFERLKELFESKSQQEDDALSQEFRQVARQKLLEIQEQRKSIENMIQTINEKLNEV